MQNFASIFNDVIGPIMRGPSSSHTAAAWRTGKMAVQIIGEEIAEVLVEFDKDGAWTTNYEEQGTVLGMNGGLLDIDMADNRMKIHEEIAKERGINIKYQINSFENNHANSMQLSLTGVNGAKLQLLSASLGGGSFELQKVDGFPVAMKGDYYLVFVWANQDISSQLEADLPPMVKLLSQNKNGSHLHILESAHPLSEEIIQRIRLNPEVEKVSIAEPIMPIVSGKETTLPFSTIASLIEYSKTENLSLGELGLMYEQHRSGLPEKELIAKMQNLISIINGSIKIGLEGTYHKDRILPQQSNLIKKAEKAKKILQNSIINTIVENVAAIMESKSALEVIVANPTAGSCGTVGAAMSAVAENVEADLDEVTMAYFAAGLVGAYFAMGPGFSAEEHGCQVECGASAGMAAAGIVEMFGGTAEQALGAASMAIQNMIGLVCDPIADRVEAPCLGKNTSAAVNALSSATMAVAGFAHLIPLDQVLETVVRVSADMPTCVKCTGLGGLAATPAALELKQKLEKLKAQR